MAPTPRKLVTIDDYLKTISADKRAALQRLRKDVHAAMPGAEECISYQMPAFRLDGKVIVWMGAGANHCAFYPGGIVEDLADALDAYETSKGTIRFPPDRPLPARLVKTIVKAAIERRAARRTTSRKGVGRR
jgi:uncharacterized protein YdhG (YjbR/CyaY superfamily)